MDMSDMNQKAWEIAAMAMIRKGRVIESYSTGQVRFFFEQARFSRFKSAIKTQQSQYSPQPSDGRSGNDPRAIADMRQRVEKNKRWGRRSLSLMEVLPARERMRFVQYLLWNIKIIEQLGGNKERIGKVLSAELVRDPEAVLEKLPEMQNQQRDRRYRRG